MKDKIIYLLVVIILIMAVILGFFYMGKQSLNKQIVLQQNVIDMQKKQLGEKPKVIKTTTTVYKPVSNPAGGTDMKPESVIETSTEIPQYMTDEINSLKIENGELKRQLNTTVPARKWGVMAGINTDTDKNAGLDYALKRFKIGAKVDVKADKTCPGMYVRFEF